LTPKEVSQVANCHLNTVYNWIKRDGLEVRKKGDRILINQDDLKKFLERWENAEKTKPSKG